MKKTPACIALVDDDLSIGKALTRLLRAVGLRATAFTCGEAFLESLAKGQPDCLVLDIAMPGMDGFAVQRRLEAIGNPVPIVFMTALRDAATLQDPGLRRAAGLLEKPFRDQELLDAIEAALARQSPTK